MSLLDDDERRALLDEFPPESFVHEWWFWARPSQLPPPGDWRLWLILAGRGFGKTRTGAEWVRAEVEAGRRGRLALIGPTAADVRDVMVEGESGILATARPAFRPTYEPSKRRLTWPNGAQAALYSAEEPDRLRGPQHDGAWPDEVAAWKYPETWDMLQFGLRLGPDPRSVATTTPRPSKLIKDLAAAPTTHITRGSTYDNLSNLAPAFAEQIIRKYEGTRLGRQELNAEILDDTPGALWQYAMFEARRPAPDMTRVVVAVDPAATSGEESDETGIVVAGLGVDGRGYVLADRSCRLSPDGWARRAVQAFDDHAADLVVAEVNNGGEMVGATIKTVRRTLPYKAIHASRGKAVRAQPVAALYEQGRISHVDVFAELEEQLCVSQGTLIVTANGLVPIEEIQVGQHVLTRAGFKPVLWAGQTGVSEVIRIETDAGLYLDATANHPVFVYERGFIPANKLKVGGIIMACHSLSGGAFLNIAASDISSILASGITELVEVGEGAYSTSISGLASTARYLTGARSTTATTIRPTTIPQTLKPSRDLSTSQPMLRAGSAIGQMSSAGRAVSRNGRGQRRGSVVAWPAAPPFSPRAPVPVFAAVSVNAVTVRSLRVRPEPVPVWNLTVAEQPEFFANGLLVHNCTWTPDSGTSPDRLDALVWALTELMVGAPPPAASAEVAPAPDTYRAERRRRW